MAESKAEKLASSWEGKPYHDEADLKGLPANVREAVLDVQATSKDLGERVARGHELHARSSGHPLALDPEHEQPTRAYRFEEVGGEIVEVRKESADGDVTITYRPDLKPADES